MRCHFLELDILSRQRTAVAILNLDYARQLLHCHSKDRLHSTPTCLNLRVDAEAYTSELIQSVERIDLAAPHRLV